MSSGGAWRFVAARLRTAPRWPLAMPDPARPHVHAMGFSRPLVALTRDFPDAVRKQSEERF